MEVDDTTEMNRSKIITEKSKSYPTKIFITKTKAKKENEKATVFPIRFRTLDIEPINIIMSKIITNSSIVLLKSEREKSIREISNLTLGSRV
jgi:hypothetical protein